MVEGELVQSGREIFAATRVVIGSPLVAAITFVVDKGFHLFQQVGVLEKIVDWLKDSP